MRCNWRAALLIAAMVVIGACAPKWREYAYPGQGFAISYSATPKATQKPGAFVVQATRGADDYEVTVSCDQTTDRTDEQLVDAGVDLWRQQCDIQSPTYVATGKVMGRELRVSKPDAPTAAVRIFAAHKCLYQVVGVSNKGPTDPVVTHFLDSFRLL
jgi:hypothetical protein